jgi:hypothetical protein
MPCRCPTVLVALSLACSVGLGVACSGDHGQPADGTTEPAPDAAAPAPVDAGADADAGEAAPPKKGLAEPCTTDPECGSNVCFKGTMSSYCSLRCTAQDAVTVCVPPFNGVCNMQGYCRKP